MNRIIKVLRSLALLALLSIPGTIVFAQNNCTCAVCGRSCSDIATYGHVQGRSCYVAPANSSSGSAGTSSPDFKTMVAGALMQNILNSIMSTNSESDKKELEAKQNAAAFEAHIAAQKAAEQQRANELRLQAEHEKMMRSFKSLDGSQNIQNKTLGGTDLAFKTLDEPTDVMKEQKKLDRMDTAWINLQKELIKDRKDNKWASGISNTLSNNAPPLPYKTFNELQPGDVLLVAPGNMVGKVIRWGDQVGTGSKESSASHTITYLKEVNGQKLFMDNLPLHGPTIISEKQLREQYGNSNMDVAQLSKFGVAQPLNKEEADKLFKAAVKMQSDNINSGNTNYGGWGKNDLVCSEASWALINSTGRTIPGTDFGLKRGVGVDFSPADFYAMKQYFLVTSLSMSN